MMDDQSPRIGSAIELAPCRNCAEPLLVPSDAPARATLECPRCHAQLAIDDLNRSPLQHWKVLPASPTSTMPGEEVGQPGSAADVAAAQQPEALAEAVASSAQVADGGGNASPVASQARDANDQTDLSWATAGARSARARTKQQSPIAAWWSIVQVVLGGVAAVPIALLLLWYVFDRDVMDAGRTVARYLPWIVPEKYHPYDLEESSASPSQRPPRRRGESGFRRFDDVLPIAPSDAEEATDLPSSPDRSPLPRPALPSASPTKDQSLRAKDEPAAELKQPLDVAADDPFLLANAAQEKVEAFLQSSPTDGLRRQLAQEAYAELLRLAQSLETIPPSSPRWRPLRDRLRALNRVISQSSEAQELIRQGSLFWLRQFASDPSQEPYLAIWVRIDGSGQAHQSPRRLSVHPDEALAKGGVATIVPPPNWSSLIRDTHSVLAIGRLLESGEDAQDLVMASEDAAPSVPSDQESMKEDAPVVDSARFRSLQAFFLEVDSAQ
ncbi:MAG: hypothetical protein KatS3mg111_1831 [Pirellulaceae bacterium]|nr:MAG: hypothetical protein KatS3mg111_1831 [Pirellulaceae bacterium]